ncbi:hypothetical protein BpHYR1_040866 [Brachionus plicatilis]|uniref:Uncharacterized protein n=1 Tax=Brachionus plicatilis TaxID=10195 RepID=A0A3M7PKY6_BRAPC|nr:hypothetical protein BpHYR1_040866 [Brachionus plicatilis]
MENRGQIQNRFDKWISVNLHTFFTNFYQSNHPPFIIIYFFYYKKSTCPIGILLQVYILKKY